MNHRSIGSASALLLTLALIAGCGPAPSSSRSPTADQDPERHRRALEEDAAIQKKNAEAERKAMSRVTVKPQ